MKNIKKLGVLITLICSLIFSNSTFAQTCDWATNFSTKDSVVAYGITTDADGYIYVTGRFDDTLTIGEQVLISQGKKDIFVAIFRPNGSVFNAFSLGGTEDDIAYSILVDNLYYIYITGITYSDYYSSEGGGSAFIAKYDLNGLLENFIPIENKDMSMQGRSITLDSENNIYVAGIIYQGNYGSGFVMKFNSEFQKVWEDLYPNKFVLGITTDVEDNVYATGCLWGETAFSNDNVNGFELINEGSYDIFVVRYGNMGKTVDWAYNYGASGYLFVAQDIATDTYGNIHVSGQVGAYGETLNALTLKIDNEGNALSASKVNGNKNSIGYGISLDKEDNVYVTGIFQDSISFGNFNIFSEGMQDVFVAKFDNNDNFLWAFNSGGDKNDLGSNISVDMNGNIYSIGGFSSTAIFGDKVIKSNGNQDMFIAKYLNDDCFVKVLVSGNHGICKGESLVLKAKGADAYEWSNGEVSDSIIVSPTMVTTYFVTGEVNNCKSVDMAIVNVDEPIVVNAGIDKTICKGATIKLVPVGANTYIWNNGSTSSYIMDTPTSSTSYSVTGISGACKSNDDVKVFVNDDNLMYYFATVNKLYTNDSTLTLAAYPDSDATYLWSTGATSQQIIINPKDTSIKYYTVSVTMKSTNCTSVYYLNMTGINKSDFSETHLSIYPNPINDQLNIAFDLFNSENINISIVDMIGKTVYEENTNTNGGVFYKKLNTENIPKGVYFIKIETKNEHIVRKIIKN